MAFCTFCGTQVPDDIKFCTSCGKPMGITVKVPAQPVQPVQQVQPQAPSPPPQPQQAPSVYARRPHHRLNRLTRYHLHSHTQPSPMRRNRMHRLPTRTPCPRAASTNRSRPADLSASCC